MDKRMCGLMTGVFLSVWLLLFLVFQFRLLSSIAGGLIAAFAFWFISYVVLPWLIYATKDDFTHITYAREMEAAKKLQPQKKEKGEVNVGVMVCIPAFITMLAVAIVGGCKEDPLTGILCALGVGVVFCVVVVVVVLTALVRLGHAMSNV